MKIIIYVFLFSLVTGCAHTKQNEVANKAPSDTTQPAKPAQGSCVAKDDKAQTNFCSKLSQRNCGIHAVCVWR